MRNAEIGQHDRIKELCDVDHCGRGFGYQRMALTNMELEVHCPYCIAAYGFRQMILNTGGEHVCPTMVTRPLAATIALRALAYDAAA